MPRHPSHLLNIARKRARLTRERHGVPELGAVPDLVVLAEDALRVPVVVAGLPDGVDGAYVPAAAGATVFLNARRPLVRQRFTLAHELGHHVLGHATSVDDARALAGDAGDGDGEQAMDERCANAFAAELLIPPGAARAWMAARPAPSRPTLEEVVRFASAFGVSASVACIRLRTADLLEPEAAAAVLRALEDGEHLPLYACLPGLPITQDTLATVAANGGTRVPATFAGSVGALRL